MTRPEPHPMYRRNRKARKKGAAVFCDAFIISLFYVLSPYASTASYFSETFFQSSTSKNAFT